MTTERPRFSILNETKDGDDQLHAEVDRSVAGNGSLERRQAERERQAEDQARLAASIIAAAAGASLAV